MDCEHFHHCLHNSLCHLCADQKLLKLPKPRKPLKRTTPKKVKEGMAFEKRVEKRYNKAFSQPKQIAKRQPNSGALWSRPGDIATPETLMECKERGTVTSKGEKQITISRAWLEKIEAEAATALKSQWYLPFGFKDDPRIYLVKDFDDELAMLQYIKKLEDQISGIRKARDEEN